MSICVSKIHKRFGDEELFRDFSLELAEGTVTCLCGPSGCGKTTLLRLLAGLDHPDSGSICGLENHRVGMLFQEHRLMPAASVRQNMELVRDPADPVSAMEWLRMVGLAESADKFPDQLSGGMRQRAAIARLLAFHSDVWLLDEPFKELDPETRQSLYALLQKYWAGKTVVLVTHDPVEAEFLGDRVITFCGRPAEICADQQMKKT